MAFGDGIRDAIKGKSKEISDALSEKYRERVGSALGEREEKLQEREAEFAQRVRQLDAREKELAQRETQLRRHFHVPKLYVFGPLLLAVAAVAAFAAMRWTKAADDTSGVRPGSAPVVDQGSPSEGACVARGIAHYRQIGTYPRLASGEDADRKVREMCSSSKGQTFGP